MSSTIKTIIRFNYSNEHSGIIFKEPLFYVGSNVNQNLLNVYGKPQDEKLVDKKFLAFIP